MYDLAVKDIDISSVSIEDEMIVGDINITLKNGAKKNYKGLRRAIDFQPDFGFVIEPA